MRTCNTCGKTKPLNEENFGYIRYEKQVNKDKPTYPRVKIPAFRVEVCNPCWRKKNNASMVRWRAKNRYKSNYTSKRDYEENKEYYKKRLRDFRLKRREKSIKYMGGCCVDCVSRGRDGIFPTIAYDFHHLDPNQKDHSPSNLMTRKDWKYVRVELDKCVLLCANCHRIRHHEQREHETT